MSRKTILVGTAVLCALALSAITAAGAQAENTTGYACVPGGGEVDFADPHCTEQVGAGSGSYGHVAVEAGEPTQQTLSGVGQQRLYAEPFLVPIEMKTEILECVECMGENVEEGGEMKAVGTSGHIRYTNVVVANNPNCTVTSDPGGEAGVIETEELKSETTGTSSLLISPAEGKVLAKFNIVTTPKEHSKKCPLIGTHTVEGTLAGTTNGATLSFNVANLTLDEAFAAEIQGEETMKAGPTGGEHYPSALT